MTHPNESTTEFTPFELMIQVLNHHGFDGLANAAQILVNEAMKIERSEVLRADPYERTSERRGYANGFKPKTLATRIGKLELQVPQTRGVEFYPKSLERGVRSERALKLAVAVNGVKDIFIVHVNVVTLAVQLNRFYKDPKISWLFYRVAGFLAFASKHNDNACKRVKLNCILHDSGSDVN